MAREARKRCQHCHKSKCAGGCSRGTASSKFTPIQNSSKVNMIKGSLKLKTIEEILASNRDTSGALKNQNKELIVEGSLKKSTSPAMFSASPRFSSTILTDGKTTTILGSTVKPSSSLMDVADRSSAEEEARNSLKPLSLKFDPLKVTAIKTPLKHKFDSRVKTTAGHPAGFDSNVYSAVAAAAKTTTIRTPVHPRLRGCLKIQNPMDLEKENIKDIAGDGGDSGNVIIASLVPAYSNTISNNRSHNNNSKFNDNNVKSRIGSNNERSHNKEKPTGKSQSCSENYSLKKGKAKKSSDSNSRTNSHKRNEDSNNAKDNIEDDSKSKVDLESVPKAEKTKLSSKKTSTQKNQSKYNTPLNKNEVIIGKMEIETSNEKNKTGPINNISQKQKKKEASIPRDSSLKKQKPMQTKATAPVAAEPVKTKTQKSDNQNDNAMKIVSQKKKKKEATPSATATATAVVISTEIPEMKVLQSEIKDDDKLEKVSQKKKKIAVTSAKPGISDAVTIVTVTPKAKIIENGVKSGNDNNKKVSQKKKNTTARKLEVSGVAIASESAIETPKAKVVQSKVQNSGQAKKGSKKKKAASSTSTASLDSESNKKLAPETKPVPHASVVTETPKAKSKQIGNQNSHKIKEVSQKKNKKVATATTAAAAAALVTETHEKMTSATKPATHGTVFTEPQKAKTKHMTNQNGDKIKQVSQKKNKKTPSASAALISTASVSESNQKMVSAEKPVPHATVVTGTPKAQTKQSGNHNDNRTKKVSNQKATVSTQETEPVTQATVVTKTPRAKTKQNGIPKDDKANKVSQKKRKKLKATAESGVSENTEKVTQKKKGLNPASVETPKAKNKKQKSNNKTGKISQNVATTSTVASGSAEIKKEIPKGPKQNVDQQDEKPKKTSQKNKKNVLATTTASTAEGCKNTERLAQKQPLTLATEKQQSQIQHDDKAKKVSQKKKKRAVPAATSTPIESFNASDNNGAKIDEAIKVSDGKGNDRQENMTTKDDEGTFVSSADKKVSEQFNSITNNDKKSNKKKSMKKEKKSSKKKSKKKSKKSEKDKKLKRNASEIEKEETSPQDASVRGHNGHDKKNNRSHTQTHDMQVPGNSVPERKKKSNLKRNALDIENTASATATTIENKGENLSTNGSDNKRTKTTEKLELSGSGLKRKKTKEATGSKRDGDGDEDRVAPENELFKEKPVLKKKKSEIGPEGKQNTPVKVLDAKAQRKKSLLKKSSPFQR